MDGADEAVQALLRGEAAAGPPPAAPGGVPGGPEESLGLQRLRAAVRAECEQVHLRATVQRVC